MSIFTAEEGGPGTLTAASPVVETARRLDPVQPERTAGVPWRPLAIAGIALVVAVGIALRFWTRSHLWLDEALTVNVAKLPVSQIPGKLRHDGAPPLYYFALHAWMSVFGSSDVAVRALSGVFGVAALPFMWVAGKRVGARTGLPAGPTLTATAALVFLASSPFAVRYATETRMYSLVVLLVLIGWLGMDTASSGSERKWGALGIVAAVTALLLYTHYWSLYLLAVLVVMLAVRVARTNGEPRQRALDCLVAVGVGSVLFLPWMPTLVYQVRHTGTPWADPASFSAMVNAVSEFAGGRSSTGRALGLTFFALAGFGLLGSAIDGHRIEVDLRTRPWARSVAVVTAATLALAITVGLISRSTFSSRYTSVVYVPFVLLVALGATVLADRRIFVAVLVAAAGFGLVTCTLNVRTDRTQAGQVAAALTSLLHPGDVVGYCPDQLGPATSRLLPASVVQITYPRASGPRFVDWVDYGRVNGAADPAAFAHLLDQRAGPGHAVWMVWSPQYRTLGLACEQINRDLAAVRPAAAEVVAIDAAKYYEHADLVRYTRK